jgi:predicted DsbA family dithiol-disulfide isomerase
VTPGRGRLLAAAGLALGAGVALASLWPVRSPVQDAAIGPAVRRYILAHPEIIPEAMDRLRLGSERAAIETPFAGAWGGNPHGDVTLVMFSDYNCPFCRASAPAVARLLAEDPKLKVVWRELPVLGPDSEAAARVALAAAKQGRFRAVHQALFAGSHPDTAGIAAAAKASGLNPAHLAADGAAPDIAAEIAANLDLARRIQISGTPFFVIGNRTFEGAMSYDALARAVSDARRGD